MNEKEFKKLIAEASEEFEDEKKERVKTVIKSMLEEYEIAKATVKRIEKQMKDIKTKGAETLLIDYDGSRR